MERIVIISDTQLPFHDEQAVKNVVKFIHDFRPASVIHIGDLMDYPTPARWNKDTRAEYSYGVKEDSETGKRFLGSIREKYFGPLYVLEGNHDLRPRVYLERYAPALGDFDFGIDQLLDFDAFGVTLVKGFHEFAPGWTATHGHLDFTLSNIAGRTSILAANKIRKNVVMGHSHRLGVIPESYGYSGNIDTQWGMEVGHLMDIRSAHYLKHGGANWQQGFGIFTIDGDNVKPEIIPVFSDATFLVDGYRFGVKRNEG
jgi:predicted phosphodiesterase